MNENRNQIVERLFQEAADLVGPARESFLAEQTAGDPELRHEVEDLLKHWDSDPRFLEGAPEFAGLDTGEIDPGVVPPAQIGPYPILGELGRGGMGVVHRGTDPRLQREIAIKVLPAAMADDPEWQARFRREAQLLASIQHPNIATIFSLEEAEGLAFLTMELVPGVLLGERLNDGALQPKEALSVCQQIAAALEAAHRQNVVHRDLKPLNVMVTDSGQVKVLDFGLAKSLVPERGRLIDGVAATDLVAGTPGYMSPEQLRGEDVDVRADVWAFGCVLFECFAGRPAFGRGPAAERITLTLGRDPDWSLLPAELPPGLRTALVRALEKKVDARLGSIRPLRREIEEEIARRHQPAPVVSAPTTVPNNLPIPLTDFVGREEDLESLGRFGREYRLVTLVGVGGAGKSRLAVEAARSLLGRYPGGVYLVELATLSDSSGLEGAVCSALEIRDRPHVSRREAISNRLAGKRTLVLLDNCEHLLDSVASFVQELTAALDELTVFATSREPLGVPGEIVYRLPPMTDAAVDLFLSRARPHDAEVGGTPGQLEVIGEICRRLDGIPLAIELAAARILLLRPEQILERLDDRFRLLTAGSRTALPRHRTLRALIDWSYEQLDEVERLFFSRLSVFVGSFTLEAAETVCTGGVIAEWEALDLLSRLVDKSLVEMVAARDPDDRARYRMLDTVGVYARESLVDVGEVEQRHRAFYAEQALLAVADLDGPEVARRLKLMERELGNYRRAIATGMALEVMPRESIAVATALLRYGHIRGLWIELRELGESVLARPEVRATRDRSLGHLYHRLGNLAQNQGDLQRATEWFDEAFALWGELGDRRNQAGILNNKGLIAHRAGDYARAEDLFRRALSVNNEIGNRDWESTNWNNLGMCANEQGNREEALGYYAKAVELARESGNTYFLATFTDNLAIITGQMGDDPRAIELHEEAIRLHGLVGNRKGESASILNMSSILAELGRVESAHECIVRGLTLKCEIGETSGIIFAVELFGGLGTALGRPDLTLRYLAAGEAARDRVGMPRHPGQRRSLDRQIAEARGKIDETTADLAWTEGLALGLEAAAEEILGRPETASVLNPTPTPTPTPTPKPTPTPTPKPTPTPTPTPKPTPKPIPKPRPSSDSNRGE